MHRDPAVQLQDHLLYEFLRAVVDIGNRFARWSSSNTYIGGAKPLANHVTQEVLELHIRVAMCVANHQEQVEEFNMRWFATTVIDEDDELIYIALIRNDDPHQELYRDESPSHA